jgi:bacterial peptide chain release factor 3 (bRF-3)
VLTFTPGEERRTDGEIIKGLDNPELDKRFPMEVGQLREDVDLIDGASPPFDLDDFLPASRARCSSARVSTTSACRKSCRRCSTGRRRRSRATPARMVEPAEAAFSGFVFKIQANMDPKHRDRIAFFRVCSGRYTVRV